MSYTAQTFNVMIASPGDVVSERAIIRDVIYEWNAIHSNMRKIVLLPIAWESHSSPDSGSSPQEIINSQKKIIVNSSKNGEVFTTTNLGFQIADMIEI